MIAFLKTRKRQEELWLPPPQRHDTYIFESTKAYNHKWCKLCLSAHVVSLCHQYSKK